MAIEINWGLLQPVDVGGAFQSGLQNGQRMAREAAVENALRDITTDQNDGGVITETGALGGVSERRRKAEGVLAAYAPERLQTITALEDRRAKTAQEIRERQNRLRIGTLATTDPAAAAREALSGGEFDLAKQLQGMAAPDAEAVHKRAEAVAPLAYQAMKMPYEQRKAFLETNRPYLLANGYKPEELDAFDPSDAALGNIVTQASTLQQLREADKVSYIPVNQGARLVGVDSFGRPLDPNAVNANQPPAQGALGGGGGSTIEGNNNPGALRVPGSTEFQKFPTREAGIQAQQRQLGRYFRRGTNTVASVVEKWAPRAKVGGDNSDASVDNYISYVAGRIGVKPGDQLATADIPRLAAAMAEFETGKRGPATGGGKADPAKVKADAAAAIAAGADPAKVKQAAAEMGVNL